MPEETKPKKPLKTSIILTLINATIIIGFWIFFAFTKETGIAKATFATIGILLGINLLTYLIYLAYKNIGKKEKKLEIPFFTEKKGDNVKIAKETAEQYLWDELGLKKNRCHIILSEIRTVELKTGQSIRAFVWYLKELVTMKRREYLIVNLIDDPNVINHREVDKRPTDDEIKEFTKQIATQPLEIEHTKTIKRDLLTGEVTEEELSRPIIPKVEIVEPKGAGKL